MAAHEVDDDVEFEEDDDTTPRVKLALPLDTQASFILALCSFHDNEIVEREGIFPLGTMIFTTFVLNALTFILQVYLSVLLFVYVIERREDPFEGNLQEKRDLLQNAMATNIPLNGTHPLSAQTLLLCWNDHSVEFSQTVILFIWFASVSMEIKDAVWSTYISFQLPDSDSGDQVMIHPKGSDEVLITSLTRSLRMLILFLVNIPRIVVTLFVAYIGAKFLEFATSVGILIMKSVSLAFIASLNQVFFQSLTPAKLAQKQKNAAYFYPEQQAPGSWMIWGSIMAGVKVAIFATTALFFARIVHKDVADIRKLCNEYEYQFEQQPVYHIFWKHLNCTTCGFTLFGHTYRS